MSPSDFDEEPEGYMVIPSIEVIDGMDSVLVDVDFLGVDLPVRCARRA